MVARDGKSDGNHARGEKRGCAIPYVIPRRDKNFSVCCWKNVATAWDGEEREREKTTVKTRRENRRNYRATAMIPRMGMSQPGNDTFRGLKIFFFLRYIRAHNYRNLVEFTRFLAKSIKSARTFSKPQTSTVHIAFIRYKSQLIKVPD